MKRRTALSPILGYEPEEWMPMGPQEGPPLPKWMGIYWPWARPEDVVPPPAPPAPPTPPPPPPVELATLYGLVTDSETGYALPGVAVSLNGYRTTTGSNGYYQFASIDPGSYEASFSKSGYREDRAVATLIAGRATELSIPLIPVAVPPLPPPPPTPPPPPPVELATLYGQVIDKETGKPLAGAVVTLDGYRTTTGSNGYYEFAGVEPGTYTVTISKAGYEEETRLVTLIAGQAKEFSVETIPTVAPPPPAPPGAPLSAAQMKQALEYVFCNAHYQRSDPEYIAQFCKPAASEAYGATWGVIIKSPCGFAFQAGADFFEQCLAEITISDVFPWFPADWRNWKCIQEGSCTVCDGWLSGIEIMLKEYLRYPSSATIGGIVAASNATACYSAVWRQMGTYVASPSQYTAYMECLKECLAQLEAAWRGDKEAADEAFYGCWKQCLLDLGADPDRVDEALAAARVMRRCGLFGAGPHPIATRASSPAFVDCFEAKKSAWLATVSASQIEGCADYNWGQCCKGIAPTLNSYISLWGAPISVSDFLEQVRRIRGDTGVADATWAIENILGT